MDFSSTLEKIESSSAFKQFKKQHPDAYLCAGFFVLDYEGSNQSQLDYSLKNRKIYTFIADKEITYKEAETIEGREEKLPEIKKQIKIDIPDIEKITKGKVDKKILKIISILQKLKDKQIWNLTIMTEGFGIIQMHVDSETGEILKHEKKNMFDFVKKIK